MKACEWLIRELCEQVRDLEGDAMEVGSYMGDSAALICELLPESTVYVYDSLGIPESEVTAEDGHRPGEFASTEKQLTEKLAGYENCQLKLGVFPHTAVKPVTLKFSHIDCDIWKTCEHSIAYAWPQTVVGGVVLIDDYAAVNCNALRLWVDRWCEKQLTNSKDLEVNRRSTRLWLTKRAVE